jgi:replicative DNA helicase
MTGRRDRDGRRRGSRQMTGGRRDDLPFDHYDAREAAMEKAEYEEIMRYVPGNTIAEAALLGALMIDNRLVEGISGRLRSEHFLEPTHGRIYDRILALVGQGKLATPVTLRPYFDGEETVQVDRDTGEETKHTIPGYLAQLTGSGAGLIGARQFAEQIIDLYLHREIIAVARDTGEHASNTAAEVNPRKIIQMAEERLQELTESIPVAKRTGAVWDDAWDESVRQAEAVAAGDEVPGITICGYEDWNEVTGRMEPADYILLGGRPSMGKTAIACAVAAGSALLGHGTDFLSLEMNRETISRRILANVVYEQGVTSQYADLNKGAYSPADRRALAEARKRIAGKPLWIDAPDEMYVEDFLPWLRARARFWRGRGVQHKLVVVDYLDRFATRTIFRNPVERVDFISRTIKTALRAAGIAGVILGQLSRAVESRDDKHPQLSDLRQSGALEQDADIVVFVYRDEYYLDRSRPAQTVGAKYDAWHDEWIASRDRVEIYSAKRREGALTKRTGFFFAAEQAVRNSTFFRSDLFGGAAAGDDVGFGDSAGFGGMA